MYNNELSRAAKALQKKYEVIPEKYTIYNGAFLFLAYPKGIKDKDHCMTPHYLVDLKHNAIGPFSPAFDLEGYFKAAEKFKDL